MWKHLHFEKMFFKNKDPDSNLCSNIEYWYKDLKISSKRKDNLVSSHVCRKLCTEWNMWNILEDFD